MTQRARLYAMMIVCFGLGAVFAIAGMVYNPVLVAGVAAIVGAGAMVWFMKLIHP